MRGISALHQPLIRLSIFDWSAIALLQPRSMGRTASTRKTEEPVGSQPAPICRRGEVPSRRSRSTRHTVSSDAGISPSKIAQSAVSPKRKASTSRLTQDYWGSSGQQAVTACAPHTPDESREKRSSKRSVRLARRDLVTASIPQQVAAVATLPTESGARTLQDAPVPVWSRELMQEATQKLSAADPCKLLTPLLFLHPALPAAQLCISVVTDRESFASSCIRGTLEDAHALHEAFELSGSWAACSASTTHTGACRS